MNLIHGVCCPPVVKVRPAKPGKPPTPIFCWQDQLGDWHRGDDLPAEIWSALPNPEREACLNHQHSRIGDGRAA